MHFRPLHDRVLVRRIDAEERTAGGIIIPDTAKEKPQEGEVIAAGPRGRNEQGQLVPLDVKPGCRSGARPPDQPAAWFRSPPRGCSRAATLMRLMMGG